MGEIEKGLDFEKEKIKIVKGLNEINPKFIAGASEGADITEEFNKRNNNINATVLSQEVKKGIMPEDSENIDLMNERYLGLIKEEELRVIPANEGKITGIRKEPLDYGEKKRIIEKIKKAQAE